MLRHVVTLILVCALALPVVVSAQGRWTPPAESDGPFSAPVIEAGAPGDITVLALPTGGRGDDLLFYDGASGWALLVINYGMYGTAPVGSAGFQLEAWCFVRLAPGLTLAAARLDGDTRHDVVGHQRATGDVFRYYRRGEGCR